ncbi:Conjugative transposon protein TcpC [Sinosporangium album]|uniref:Conjugative transposon protein TcpC n=1 Tax=Sinosporangium album TaxID=504805 RepID=A0A1G7Y1X2_9ACTN|nr:conjugal transfer protein [Sinosporangium album]SDG89930.1 Conjugative transposon protein TcpC [Sinosporangium album]
MARRATVQHGPRTVGDPELPAYSDSSDLDQPPARGRGAPRRGGWAGGGGRWLVWAGRAVLWALIIVIVVNGVRAPFERFMQGSSPSAPPPAPEVEFPVQRAESFAGQFAEVYLNIDGSRPDERAGRLAPYIRDEAGAQFGWDGLGLMRAGAIRPYETKVIDDRNALVTVLFQSGNRRMMLSVPVYSSGNSLLVSGLPAVLPAPAKATYPSPPDSPRDEAAESELRPQLESFFRQYAEGDTVELQRFLAADVRLESLNGAFDFSSLKDVRVPPGEAERRVRAVVVWSVPSSAPGDPAAAEDPARSTGKLEQAYSLTVVKTGGKWFVKEISGAARNLG